MSTLVPNKLKLDLIEVYSNPSKFFVWVFEPFVKDFPSWGNICLLAENFWIFAKSSNQKELVLSWANYARRSMYRTWVRERQGHYRLWKAWTSDGSWFRKVLLLEFLPFMVLNRMVERVPLGTIAFPLLLFFGSFLGLPYWACLVLWAYALESVLVCLGHRYSPLAKAALEWVTFGPKNLQFYWGNPGTNASRGVLVFTFGYGLYKAEMYQYNWNREKALQWAAANARTSAEAAVKALPEGASADMVSNTFNSVSRETLNTTMEQWDMSNNPFPRWRRVLGLETPSAEFSLDVDSQGNYTVKGSAKPKNNMGFAAGGEIGKKRYPPCSVDDGESSLYQYPQYLCTSSSHLWISSPSLPWCL